MKKRAGLILTVIMTMAMLLGGCGAKSPAPSVSIDSATDTTTDEKNTEIDVEANAESNADASKETEDQADQEADAETKDEKSGESVADQTVRKEEVKVNDNPKMEALTAGEVVSQMKLGWSLGNTLDVQIAGTLKTLEPETWETGWGNPITTPDLIKKVVDKGFNVIRIPVTWNDHLIVDENYKIVDSWMDRVQEVVDYAYDQGAYVILNAHHESWYYPYYDNEEQATKMLEAVWSQIAERFQDYDEHLLFEGMNEPRKVGTSMEWNGGDREGWEVVNRFNTVFVNTIRSTGGNNPYRILMIPGYGASAWEGIKHLEIPDGDNKIIASVHAYEPYTFALDINGRGNWNEDTAAIDMIMKSLDNLFISKGIPVIIGEFGAMYKPAEGNEKDRGAWAEYYTRSAAELGIPCVWWDNGAFAGDGELFGLIDRETYEWKYPLVVEGLLRGAN